MVHVHYSYNEHMLNKKSCIRGLYKTVIYSLATQSVVPGPVALASPGSLLDMQNLRPWGLLQTRGIRACILTRYPGDSCRH